MTEEPFETSENARRDRREHGGAPMRPDDDELARRTEQERVDAGVEDYDPDELPPATDEPVPTDLTESEDYQETEAEIRREEEEGEIYQLTDRHPFPPSHYDRP
jgi:hypothetical protein